METLLKADYAKSYQVGNELFASHKRQIRSALRDLVLKDGSLDGATMQTQWFPQVEADVFISHSHGDEESVIILAGLLYRMFAIKCFTDTTVWGYGAELLEELDKSYCSTGKPGSYSYSLRNVSTSHVYLMLAGALSKMIDNTECIFFLNSPSSIIPSQVMDATLSPWLYFEVLTSQLVRKKLPKEHARRLRAIEKSFSDTEPELINESFSMTHTVELGHLTPLELDKKFYKIWQDKSQGNVFKLDALYKIRPEKHFV